MGLDLGLKKKNELAATPVAGVAGGPTYFDEASEFSGTLRLQKSATIDGHIEGEIDCEQSVTVGPSGSVSARVRAESVVIHGEVHGDIEARSEITLHKTARVHGDMSTQGIVIEKGAQVEGRITIGTANAAARLPAPSTPLEMGTGSGTDRSQEAHKSQG